MSVGSSGMLSIRTPEGVTFCLPLAGPVARLLAWCIDVLIQIALMIALNFVVGLAAALVGSVAMAFFLIGMFAITIGYSMALEWFCHGQTIGKKVLGLRVMDDHALPLQPQQVVLRNLLRLVDFLPGTYLVGGTACLLSRHCQRLGDLAAGTVVTRQIKQIAPDARLLAAERTNAFRQYPHLEARLRQHVQPAQTQLALRCLGRRDELDPNCRLELLAALADFFRQQAAFPPEATDGLSDEQYVRNVVETLCRQQGHK